MKILSQTEKITRMDAACRELLRAYAKNHSGDGSIDWADVDRAFELAKKALPGVYPRMVKQMAKGD